MKAPEFVMPLRKEGDFEALEASKIFCPTCKRAMPLRERLFLALPDWETFDYVCVGCGTLVGVQKLRPAVAQRRPLEGLPVGHDDHNDEHRDGHEQGKGAYCNSPHSVVSGARVRKAILTDTKRAVLDDPAT
jgi:hypothetical protein